MALKLKIPNVDNTNYLAYKYNEAVFEQFCTICEPLFKCFNVKYFSYLKIFSDGRYLKLSNNLNWQKFYFENINDNPISLEGEVPVKCLGELTPFLCLWLSQPNSILTQSINQHGLWESFYFKKFNNEFTEMWTFSGSHTHLRHSNLFVKFINYFNFKAKDLINSKEDSKKLAIYQDWKSYPNIWPPIEQDLVIDGFLKQINLENEIPRSMMLRNVHITKREFESLLHLSRGKTIKEIARSLNLGYRTIESYIGQVKNKTGYRRRSDLVKFFQDSVQ